MTSENPLVSIIIPNYNGEGYLKGCISTILKSKYDKFELLFVDDGSTDESKKIIKRFILQDKRIKLYKNKKNLGASASRNKGLKECKGNVIVFLDNDVEVKKDWLNRLLETLFSSDNIGATCPKMPILTEKNIISTAGLKLIPHVGWGVALGGHKSVKHHRNKQEDVISISAALAVKKEVIDKIGGFDEKLAVHTEDLDFFLENLVVWLANSLCAFFDSLPLYKTSRTTGETDGGYKIIYLFPHK